MSRRNTANPAVWLAPGIFSSGLLQQVESVVASWGYLSCTLFIFLCQVQIWTWATTKTIAAKTSFITPTKQKTTLRKKTIKVLNSQFRQCAKVYFFKTQRTENTVRKTDYDINVSKMFFLEVGENNWTTIPSLFFIVQLEFVYNVDYLLTYPRSCKIFYKKTNVSKFAIEIGACDVN